MKDSQVVISIVIANKNGQKFIRRCLDSVFCEKGKYEVIVIDDGSEDLSVDVVRTYIRQQPQLKLIELPTNLGAAEARNIGVANSVGKYIFFLDSDTKVKIGWYKEVVNFFEKNKSIGAAQVKLLTMNSNNFDYAGDFMGPLGFLIERARGSKDLGQFDRITKIFSGKSAGMIIRKSVYELVGGFDRDYIIFLEDTDIFWRVWLAGYEVAFAPSIVVWHAFWTKEKPFAFYISNRVFYRGCRNTIMTQIKNFGSLRATMTIPVNVACWLVIALVFLARGKFTRSWAILNGILWNIAFLPKTLIKRRQVQMSRKISDSQLFAITGSHQSLNYYLGKALAYTAGRSF